VEPCPPCSAEFRLSITKALGDQLSDAIRRLEPAPLNYPTLGNLKADSGVYQLYRSGSLVYVGKADGSLPERLGQHLRKISGRQNISLSEMTFTCLYVAEDLSAVAPETLLIKRYQGEGTVLWNTNGFGGRDPGRRRDTTMVTAGHFDAAFPIDLDVEVDLSAGHPTMKRLLELLKDSLPYTFRYERALVGKGEIAMSAALISDGRLAARQAFRILLSSLPPGWQLTALPGRAILYKESRPDVYDSALAWWRSEQDGTVSETIGPHLIDESDAAKQLDMDDEALETEE
jgi:Eco29kI restriction endonuclease